MPAPIVVAIGEVVALVIGAIGRVLLRKGAQEAAKKAGQEAAKKALKDEVKDELKDQVRDISQEMLDEAIDAVKHVVGEAGEEMKQEANRKATELRLIATGSPNPTAPRQPEYKDYYRRRIPFRPVICKLLCFADKNPVLGKRKLPAPTPGPDEEIKYRVLELRQLTAAISFDLLDHALEHHSFIKSEVAFKRDGTAYMATGTQPKRIGQTYWRKPRGSVSPDIAIVENRFEPPGPQNLFAVVDFKFQRDNIDRKQIDNYDDAFGRSKVSIIRMPQDCPPCEGLDKKQPGEGRGKASRRTSR